MANYDSLLVAVGEGFNMLSVEKIEERVGVIVDFANSGCVTTEEMVQIIRDSLGLDSKVNDSELKQLPYIVDRDICIQSFKIKIFQISL